VRVAELAGAAIMRVYEGERDEWEVQAKADASPLTRADTEAHALICAQLTRLAPGVSVMSEESTQQADFEQRHDARTWSEVYWCVDPLDGTREFLKRNGEFTVNIALVTRDQGAPILGVVHAPALNETYFAVLGEGAFRRAASVDDGAEQVTRLHAASFNEKDAGLVVVCSRSHLDERTSAYMAQLDAPRAVSMGSSLKFMLIARGDAHIYPRFAPTMEWDTAASQIIVQEAGGSVLNADTLEPLAYNKRDLRNPYFLCSANRI